MRKTLLAIMAILILAASPALAGPPCRTDVGGLCGSDYDGWMATWHRTNPGKVIQPVSPGGYGILPNGQVFYPNQGGVENHYMDGGRPGVTMRTVVIPGPAQNIAPRGYGGEGRPITRIVRVYAPVERRAPTEAYARQPPISAPAHAAVDNVPADWHIVRQ